MWNGDNDSVAKMKAAEDALQEKEKQKPSFELSKLAAKLTESRCYFASCDILLNEPRMLENPDIRWLYVFKVKLNASEDGDDDDNSVTET
ncbi:FHA domain-containing protein DDL [Camellia lanceoleosa]|uniref:FHA domain-containing protein DDL n=1 Tax=Camellia lanceoleosa TaxID=1840588 RepID=A0ACC0IDF6_9ERIC|nr:FHA domain-containing protein DDL [Camellia lanceoleosa]